VKQGEHIYILFRDGKIVKDKRYKGKMKTYASIESYLGHRGEVEGDTLIEYAPVVEAAWVDVTKPGQLTCGGNPVYACGNCGDIYGSFEIFPSAQYCKMCGARLRMTYTKETTE
jgi:hypothetical protein